MTEEIKWPGWQTVNKIGQGSYGEVYEIERTVDGVTEKAALKVMSFPLSEYDTNTLYESGVAETVEEAIEYINDQIKMMITEIDVMADFMGIPGIVRYQDHKILEHDGWPGADVLIKMELLTPLTKYVKEHPLEELDVIRLGYDMCTALEVCHNHVPKILHRDIKMANIMVSPTGNFKLGDFGVARIIEGNKSAHTKAGTEDYMAPEVYRGDGYHEGADIYSLGMLLYRLMNNNRFPFLPSVGKVSYSDKMQSRERRIAGEKLPAPLNGSSELKAVVLKALEVDPKQRYQSAEEFKNDLWNCVKSVVAGPVVVVKPPVYIEEHALAVTPGDREFISVTTDKVEALVDDRSTIRPEHVLGGDNQFVDDHLKDRRYRFAPGKHITLGEYYETIDWVILDYVNDKKILVVSDKAVDIKPFDENNVVNVWADCSLRKWLNSDFLDIALHNKRKMIFSDEETGDKVFLLSKKQVEKYYEYNFMRCCKPTDYATKSGAFIRQMNSTWWLRDPGSDNHAFYVNYDGSVKDIAGTLDMNCYGVRPAMWIDIDELETDQKKISRSGLYSVGNRFSMGDYHGSIDWTVIAADGDSALIISDFGLDIKPFDKWDSTNTWSECSLRAWLNGDFYNEAFGGKQTSVLFDYETGDKVFLLSAEQARYFMGNDRNRRCQPTKYAKKQLKGRSGGWWLRDAGDKDNKVADVTADGAINRNGDRVDFLDHMVRPAMWIRNVR